MKLSVAISLVLAAVCTAPTIAQSASPAIWEVGAGYNFVHTNAPPTGCGCFSMNGGVASVNRQLTPSFSLVGEFNGVANGNVNASGHSLTLLTYLSGPRYRYVPSHGRLSPYGQILVGGAHASGGLYAPAGSSTGTANAFATSIGGGVDLSLSPRFSFRVVQADYLLTLLPNSVNSRQNNVSLSTGVILRFGSR
jgi:peptidoglycan-associated lipoprotein